MARQTLSCLGAVLLFLASPAATPSIVSAAGVRPWLSVHALESTYSMSDVNSDIGNINALIAPSGLRMDEINRGLGLGAAFGLEIPGGFSIGLGYDRLTGSSDVSDPTGSIEYDLPANVFRAFGQYSIRGPGALGAHVGASLGVVSEAGSVTLTITDLRNLSTTLRHRLREFTEQRQCTAPRV